MACEVTEERDISNRVGPLDIHMDRKKLYLSTYLSLSLSLSLSLLQIHQESKYEEGTIYIPDENMGKFCYNLELRKAFATISKSKHSKRKDLYIVSTKIDNFEWQNKTHYRQY